MQLRANGADFRKRASWIAPKGDAETMCARLRALIGSDSGWGGACVPPGIVRTFLDAADCAVGVFRIHGHVFLKRADL